MAAEMSEQARAARRDYQRDWRRKNPDKVEAANARYWEKKAQKTAQSTAK